MNPVIRYTFLAFEINHQIDEGKKLDIEETKSHIVDGTLFDWLKGQYDDMDLSLYREDEKSKVLELFVSLKENVDSRRKFGVEKDGLSLLLAYCIEGLQQLRHEDGNYN